MFKEIRESIKPIGGILQRCKHFKSNLYIELPISHSFPLTFPIMRIISLYRKVHQLKSNYRYTVRTNNAFLNRNCVH